MTSPQRFIDDRDKRWGEVLVACLEAEEKGRPFDRCALLAAHPEFAEELAKFIAQRDRFEQLAAPLRAVAQRAAVPTKPDLGEDTFGVPASASDNTAARSFGDYEILGRIARGGMGVVYKARQVSLNRIVALKMVRGEDLESEEKRRFEQEAEIVAELDHPHIVPIYEIGQQAGHHFFAMRLIPGESLAQHLPHFKSDPKAAARLLAVVARAIHHAHQRGILHRDLKPSNILLDPDGQPHVTDFGLAKRLVGDSGLTETGQILGTPSYMAPEQTESKRGAITTATDVYGLGAVFYTLLTGQPPFQGETPLDTLIQVKEIDPQPPRRHNPFIPHDLETVCLKCLVKDPAARYPNALALAEELERWLKGEPIQARPMGWLERSCRWSRRNPLLAGLSVALASLVLLGIAALVIGLAVIAGKNVAVQEQYSRALDREKSLRRLLYAADMRMAHEAWEQAELERVRLLLAKYEPAEGKEDLRTFPWYLLNRLSNGAAPQTLDGHRGDVYCVVYSPDGKEMASAGKDGTVRLWDAVSGAPRQIIRVSAQEVNAVAYTPDGKSLATAADDGLVKLSDRSSAKQIGVLTHPPGEQIALAFSANGRWLAVAGKDQVEVFAWPTLGRAGQLIEKNARQEAVAIAPNSQLLAVATGLPGQEGKVKATGNVTVYNLEPHGSPVSRFAHYWPDAVRAVAFSPDGRLLAVAVGNGMDLYDVASGTKKAAWVLHHDKVQTVAFSLDGLLVASAGNDGRVFIHEVRTGQIVGLLGVPHQRIWCVAFSRNGKMVTAGTSTGTILRWTRDGHYPGQTLSVRPSSKLAGCLLSPDARRFVFWVPNEVCELWDPVRGRLIKRLFACGITRPEFTADGRLVGLYCPDRHFRFWETAGGKCLHDIQDPAHISKYGSFTLTRRAFAFFNEEKHAGQCFDLNGHEIASLPTGGTFVKHVFSPDGRTLAEVETNRGFVQLWDLATQSRTHRIPGPGAVIRTIVYNRSGDFLALGTSHGGLTVWDTHTGQLQWELTGHLHSIACATFSLDGLTLATGSGSEIKLWDTRTGLEILRLATPGRSICSLAFTEDGMTLRAAAFAPDSAAETLEWAALPLLRETAEPRGR